MVDVYRCKLLIHKQSVASSLVNGMYSIGPNNSPWGTPFPMDCATLPGCQD